MNTYSHIWCITRRRSPFRDDPACQYTAVSIQLGDQLEQPGQGPSHGIAFMPILHLSLHGNKAGGRLLFWDGPESAVGLKLENDGFSDLKMATLLCGLFMGVTYPLVGIIKWIQ